MATTSFFTALVEPLLTRTRVKNYELALGIFVLPGMALVVGNVSWTMRVGFMVGVVGALLAAIFSALNKKVVDKDPPPPLAMSFVELFAAFVVTSIALPVMLLNQPSLQVLPQGWDWIWLAVLSGVCTLLPYYLTLKAMRYLSAFTANLIINLEPVYGVLLAALFFREDKEMNTAFYFGVLIILLAVFSHPFLRKRFDK